MQPTYLPWPGFFNLMASADRFILLDDAQFQRRSWQCRNRIVLDGKETFLSVPVCRADRSARINEIRISYTEDWRRIHSERVRHSYSRAPFGSLVSDLIDAVLLSRPERLVTLNLSLISEISALLKINTPRLLSSELGVSGVRSQRLLGLCSSVGAYRYLSPAGSIDYLETDQFSANGAVSLYVQEFRPDPYHQVDGDGFIPAMSVIDLIANVGVEAASKYVRNGAFRAVTG